MSKVEHYSNIIIYEPLSRSVQNIFSPHQHDLRVHFHYITIDAGPNFSVPQTPFLKGDNFKLINDRCDILSRTYTYTSINYVLLY